MHFELWIYIFNELLNDSLVHQKNKISYINLPKQFFDLYSSLKFREIDLSNHNLIYEWPLFYMSSLNAHKILYPKE